MTAVIEARDLSKSFGEVQAVDHVTLAVEKGALFGLLGPNGSGKTTMIKMLTGQTRPTGGTASVLGIDVTADPVGIRERVGIIPEQETPPSFLTSLEYLKSLLYTYFDARDYNLRQADITSNKALDLAPTATAPGWSGRLPSRSRYPTIVGRPPRQSRPGRPARYRRRARRPGARLATSR